MKANNIYLFIIMGTYLATCQTDEEDVDYSSDDISDNVQNLKIEGAEYLRKVMEQLQSERTEAQMMQMPDFANLLYTQRVYQEEDKEHYHSVTPVYNITGPTPVPEVEAEVVPDAVPPLPLTKEELLALYEAALTKASMLPLLQTGSQPNEELNQVVPVVTSGSKDAVVQPALKGQMGNPVSGYYYYYFPIKSFLTPTPKPTPIQISKSTPAPPPAQQLHATITMMESPNKKAMEPLFMAISGFIGMALFFLFSVLFMPKFGKLRSKHAQFKDTPDEMATFAQLVLEAMTGKDCSERFACEIARIFRGLKTNNKPLRILEIILPPNLSKQIAQIRKAAGKKAKCGYIPCKMKRVKAPEKPNQKPKPVKKKETPHDLWMKHFEKKKPPLKQEQGNNVWKRKPSTPRTH